MFRLAPWRSSKARAFAPNFELQENFDKRDNL
jgi:hypothetical protein